MGLDEREPTLRELTALFKAYKETMAERDRRYEERFKAQEAAVAAALGAADKLTTSAFAASKEAIIKAEASQATYNATHNDLTRKMDAQYKEMLPRPEADSKFRGIEEKIEEIKKDTAGLRESRSQVVGHREGHTENRTQAHWIIGVSITLGLGLLGFFLSVAIFLATRGLPVMR